MAEKTPRIWKLLRAEPKTQAQRVLDRCKKDTVDCWRSDDYDVRLAVFLQSHPRGNEPPRERRAKVCIAYESHHPKPIHLRRRLEVAGGTLGHYDPEEVIELPSGRNRGRSYRSALLPQWVAVERQPDGVAQINAQMQLLHATASVDPEPIGLSVTFSEEEPLPCPCC
jgi:hypothetical protein